MNELLQKASDFLARHKGLPVIIGIGMILLNLLLNLLPTWPVVSWFAATDILLHLGAALGLFGILLGDAL